MGLETHQIGHRVIIVTPMHAHSSKGKVITGITDAEQLKDVVVFHAGTTLCDGQVVTNGGRVLGVTAMGQTTAQAKAKAYEAVERIHFEGAYCRTDIANKAIRT